MARDEYNKTMEDLSDRNPLVFAALIFFRRELAKVSEVRLTPLDFEAWESSEAAGVLLKYDHENGDIILTHVAERSDA